MKMTELQSELCLLLQEGLQPVERPFAGIAQALGIDQLQLLDQTNSLVQAGVIRRICPFINYRALGRVATLVGAEVPADKLEQVAATVTSMAGVSHNYLRAGKVNLWFTLQGGDYHEIQQTLDQLAQRFAIVVHNLPVKRFFKLHVRFGGLSSDKPKTAQQQQPRQINTPVKLSDVEKKALNILQQDFPLVSRPFDRLAGDDMGVDTLLSTTGRLIDKGVIKRIAAAVNQKKLGIKANIMFTARLSEQTIITAGPALAGLDMVSHCYERYTSPPWKYNLFGMMHARCESQIRQAVADFVDRWNIEDYAMFASVREFKKKPVRLRF